MDNSSLRRWRQVLGINRDQAAALLGISSSRYGDLERGYLRGSRTKTNVTQQTCYMCTLLLTMVQDYNHVDDLIKHLEGADIVFMINTMIDKDVFPKLKQEKDAISASRREQFNQIRKHAQSAYRNNNQTEPEYKRYDEFEEHMEIRSREVLEDGTIITHHRIKSQEC